MRPNAADGGLAAHAGGEHREFRYTRRDFARVRRLIHARAGIALSDGKFNMVYSRLSRRLRALSLGGVGAYLDQLERRDEAAEWQHFIGALTTHLTAFFREPHHFDLLRAHCAAIPRDRPVRIWCCAASTGEEPYSIAMTALEHFGGNATRVRILATDIDTRVLETAAAGVYPLERVEHLPDRVRKRYFQRGAGAQEGYCRVADEVRQLLVFRPLNLLDDRWPVRGPLDAIFCRNVMIYFDQATQRRILERFQPLLQPDGLLVAGHSESFLHAADLFRSGGRTVYRRADAPGLAA